jgi:alpha-glucosidase
VERTNGCTIQNCFYFSIYGALCAGRQMTPTLKRLARFLSCVVFLICCPAHADAPAGKIELSEIFHDQGPLFCDADEPSSKRPLALSIRCRRHDVSRASLKFFDEADGKYHILPMSKKAAAAGAYYDLWQASLPSGRSRKHYRFILSNDSASAFYNAAGASISETEDRDFLVVPDFRTPGWLKDGVIYQIFPDRFFDGNPANNIKSGDYTFAGSPVIQRAWNESPIAAKGENAGLIFFGGDLEGVLDRLSYIRKTLGANIVYLNPVFESPTNHKYDTSDYNHVAACLGDETTLARLSSALHEKYAGRRAYLILDGVFNHTGDSHSWFGKYAFRSNAGVKGAYQLKSSPFYSYYSFSKWPDKYATFLDVASLPKLDYGSPALKREIFASPGSIALKYLRPPFSIDGWRLDAPQHVDCQGRPGSDNFNHQIWREFRGALKSVSAEAAILGEIWQSAPAWISGGDQWDSITNFAGFTEPLSEWLCGVNLGDGPASLSVAEFDRWLRLTRVQYPFNAQQALSNHLSNHDISRFAQRAKGDAGKIALALIFQMTYLGVPTIYYGDEYGLAGGRDPDCRRTFDWAQDDGKNQLIALAHRLIELRNKYAALRSGSFITLHLDNRSNTYAFGRMDRHKRIAVVLNADVLAHDLPVPSYKLEIPDGDFVIDELSGSRYQAAGGKISLKLAPASAAILVH